MDQQTTLKLTDQQNQWKATALAHYFNPSNAQTILQDWRDRSFKLQDSTTQIKLGNKLVHVKRGYWGLTNQNYLKAIINDMDIFNTTTMSVNQYMYIEESNQKKDNKPKGLIVISTTFNGSQSYRYYVIRTSTNVFVASSYKVGHYKITYLSGTAASMSGTNKLATVQINIPQNKSSVKWFDSQLIKQKSFLYYRNPYKSIRLDTSQAVLQSYYGDDEYERMNIMQVFYALTGSKSLYFPFTFLVWYPMYLKGFDNIKQIHVRNPRILVQYFHFLHPQKNRLGVETTGQISLNAFEKYERQKNLESRTRANINEARRKQFFKKQIQQLTQAQKMDIQIIKIVQLTNKQKKQSRTVQYGQELKRVFRAQNNKVMSTFQGTKTVQKIQQYNFQRQIIPQQINKKNFKTYSRPNNNYKQQDPQSPLIQFLSTLSIFSLDKKPTHFVVLEKMTGILVRQSIFYYFMVVRNNPTLHNFIAIVFDLNLHLIYANKLFQFVSFPNKEVLYELLTFFSHYQNDQQVKQILTEQIKKYYDQQNIQGLQNLISSQDEQNQYVQQNVYAKSQTLRKQVRELNQKLQEIIDIQTNLFLLLTQNDEVIDFKSFYDTIKGIFEKLYRVSISVRLFQKDNQKIKRSSNIGIKKNRNFLLLDIISARILFGGMLCQSIYNITLKRFKRKEEDSPIDEYKKMLSATLMKNYIYTTLTTKNYEMTRNLLTLQQNKNHFNDADFAQAKSKIQDFLVISKQSVDEKTFKIIQDSYRKGQPMIRILKYIKKNTSKTKKFIQQIKLSLSRIHNNHVLSLQAHLRNINAKKVLQIKQALHQTNNQNMTFIQLKKLNQILRRYDFSEYNNSYPSKKQFQISSSIIYQQLQKDIYLGQYSKFNSYFAITSQLFDFPQIIQQDRSKRVMQHYPREIKAKQYTLINKMKSIFLQNLKKKPTKKRFIKQVKVDVTPLDVVNNFEYNQINKIFQSCKKQSNEFQQANINYSRLPEFFWAQYALKMVNQNQQEIKKAMIGKQDKQMIYQQFEASQSNAFSKHTSQSSFWVQAQNVLKVKQYFGNQGVIGCGKQSIYTLFGSNDIKEVSITTQNLQTMRKQILSKATVLNQSAHTNPNTESFILTSNLFKGIIRAAIQVCGEANIYDDDIKRQPIFIVKEYIINPLQSIEDQSEWLYHAINDAVNQFKKKFSMQTMVLKISRKIKNQMIQMQEKIQDIKQQIIQTNQNNLNRFVSQITSKLSPIQQYGSNMVQINQDQFYNYFSNLNSLSSLVWTFCNMFEIQWNGNYNDLKFMLEEKKRNLQIPPYLRNQMLRILNAIGHGDKINMWNQVIINQIAIFQNNIGTLSMQIQQGNYTVQQLNAELNHCKNQIQTYATQMNLAKQNLAKLQQDKLQQLNRLNLQLQKYAKNNENFLSQNITLKNKIDQLAARNNTSAQKQAQFVKLCDNYKTNLQKLNLQLKEKSSYNEDLLRQNKMFQERMNDLIEKTRQLLKIQDMLNQERIQSSDSISQVVLEKKNQRKVQNQSNPTMIKKAVNIVSRSIDQISLTYSQSNVAKNALPEPKKFEKKIIFNSEQSNAVNQIATLIRVKAELQEQNQALSQQRQRFRILHQQQTQDLMFLMNQWNQTKQKIGQLQQIIRTLHLNQATLNDNLRKKNEQYTKLNQMLAKNIQGSKGQLEKQKKQFDNKDSISKKQISDLKVVIETSKKKEEQAQKQKTNLNNIIDQTKKQLEGLKKTSITSDEEKKKMANILQQKQKLLSSMNTEKKQLEQKIINITANLQELQKKKAIQPAQFKTMDQYIKNINPDILGQKKTRFKVIQQSKTSNEKDFYQKINLLLQLIFTEQKKSSEDLSKKIQNKIVNKVSQNQASEMMKELNGARQAAKIIVQAKIKFITLIQTMSSNQSGFQKILQQLKKLNQFHVNLISDIQSLKVNLNKANMQTHQDFNSQALSILKLIQKIQIKDNQIARYIQKIGAKAIQNSKQLHNYKITVEKLMQKNKELEENIAKLDKQVKQKEDMQKQIKKLRDQVLAKQQLGGQSLMKSVRKFREYMKTIVKNGNEKLYDQYFAVLQQQISKQSPDLSKSEQVMKKIVKYGDPKGQNLEKHIKMPPQPEEIQKSPKKQRKFADMQIQYQGDSNPASIHNQNIQKMKRSLKHQKQVSVLLFQILVSILTNLGKLLAFFQRTISDFKKSADKASGPQKQIYGKVVNFFSKTKGMVQYLLDTDKAQNSLVHLTSLDKQVKDHFDKVRSQMNAKRFNMRQYMDD